jgi:hypothetical protein
MCVDTLHKGDNDDDDDDDDDDDNNSIQIISFPRLLKWQFNSTGSIMKLTQ